VVNIGYFDYLRQIYPVIRILRLTWPRYLVSDRLRDNVVLKSQWLWLGLIFAAGAALRFYRIDAMSLWGDEAFQYQIATAGSLSEVIRGALAVANPPLSQIINYFFLQTGTSDFFLRLPSVLFGVASIPIFYLVATKMVSQRVALIATALFAFSPFHLWYSQEARPYAQLMFFSLLSTQFVIAALEYGGMARWTAYVMVVIFGFATQVFMGFMFAAHMAWVITCHKDRLQPYLVASFAIVLSFAWLLPFFVRSFIVSIGRHERTGFSAGELAYTFFTYSAGFSFGPSNVDLHLDRSLSGLAQFAPSILSVALVFGVLCIMGIWAPKGKNRQQGRALCLYCICIAIGGSAVYSLGATYNVRYTSVAFPFFCILVAVGIDSLRRKREFWGASFMAGVALITVLSVYNYFETERYFKPDVRSAVAYWQQGSGQEPLLSNLARQVNCYIDASERKRFYAISSRSDRVAEIKNYFSSGQYSLVHVLISKRDDWAGSFEEELRKKWKIVAENRFDGAVIVSIKAKKRPYP
jgi:uncharacterized membrane protein